MTPTKMPQGRRTHSSSARPLSRRRFGSAGLSRPPSSAASTANRRFHSVSRSFPLQYWAPPYPAPGGGTVEYSGCLSMEPARTPPKGKGPGDLFDGRWMGRRGWDEA